GTAYVEFRRGLRPLGCPAKHFSRGGLTARATRFNRPESDAERRGTSRLATDRACPRSRDEQFAGSDQIARGQSGIAHAARSSPTRLEGRRERRIELYRLPGRFARPFSASLHAADQTSATSKTRCRPWRAGSACRGLGAEAQCKAHARSENSDSCRRSAN